MTSSPFRDAPGAMAEERRLRIASAPSTVCLHGTGRSRWLCFLDAAMANKRERERVFESRGK